MIGKMISELKNITDKPLAIILVGHPLSGKSTYIKPYKKDFDVISFDDFMLDFYGVKYDNEIPTIKNKELDKAFSEHCKKVFNKKQNLIIDKTNLSINTRRSYIEQLKNSHFLVCLTFPVLSLNEISKRNDYRNIKDYKNIRIESVIEMLNNYTPPSISEGWDLLLYL